MFDGFDGAPGALASDMCRDLRVSHNGALGGINEIDCGHRGCLKGRLLWAWWFDSRYWSRFVRLNSGRIELNNLCRLGYGVRLRMLNHSVVGVARGLGHC